MVIPKSVTVINANIWNVVKSICLLELMWSAQRVERMLNLSELSPTLEEICNEELASIDA